MRWRVSGDSWRLAPALVTLATQLNEIWPVPHPTDGTVGDLAHQTRKSDHNPNAVGVVTALDVGETVENQGAALVDQLVRARDQRVKYIIHEARIWRNYPKNGTPPWVPRSYSGSNPHSSHVHVSVRSQPVYYADPGLWALGSLQREEEPMLTRGSNGIAVRQLQAGILAWNSKALPKYGADSDYGGETELAVTAFQKAHGLPETGQADGVTFASAVAYLTPPVTGIRPHTHKATLTIGEMTT